MHDPDPHDQRALPAPRNGDESGVHPDPETSVGRLPGGASSQAARLADTFFGDEDPFARPARASANELPECPHFYASSVIAPTKDALDPVVRNGALVYLQGAAVGVGMSTFLADYAEAAAERAGPGEQPVVYWRVSRDLTGPWKALESLIHCVGASLSNTQMRFRAASVMRDQFLQVLRTLRVRALLIDHVHLLPPPVLGWLAGLIWTARRRQKDPGLSPIGFALAAPQDPRLALGREPEVATTVNLAPTILKPYTPSDIAEILPAVGFAQESFRRSRWGLEALAEEVWELTQGHVARMNPLFRIMLNLERYYGGAVPLSTLVTSATTMAEGVSELRARRVRDPRWEWEGAYTWHVEVPPPGASPNKDETATTDEDPPKKKTKTKRERDLAERRDQQARAETLRERRTRERRQPREGSP